MSPFASYYDPEDCTVKRTIFCTVNSALHRNICSIYNPGDTDCFLYRELIQGFFSFEGNLFYFVHGNSWKYLFCL
jgi:hypothetical protein